MKDGTEGEERKRGGGKVPFSKVIPIPPRKRKRIERRRTISRGREKERGKELFKEEGRVDTVLS